MAAAGIESAAPPGEEAADEPLRTVTRLGEYQRVVDGGPARTEVVGTSEYERLLLTYLDQLCAPAQVRLLSVDVFDTVLLRQPISELRRFMAIARRQADALEPRFGTELSALDLLVARLQATHAGYRMSDPVRGSREGSIIQIYRAVETVLGLRADAHRLLLDVELDYEATVLYPHLPLCRWLEDMARNGVDVVLLSDMYLHHDHIERLLERADVLPGVSVISSAENKMTKHSGRAFEHLLSIRGVDASEVVHLGDNLRSDYRMARRYGIRSGLLPIPTLERVTIRNDHEQVVEEMKAEGVDLSRWISCGQ